jgi:hypothetical protein
MIHIVRVNNPLQPSVGRQSYEQEFFPGGSRSLDDVLTILRVSQDEDPVGEVSLAETRPVVSLNGNVIEYAEWRETYPVDGDSIVIAPKLGNGTLLRTLASVAVMAAAIAGAALIPGGAVFLGMSGSVLTGVVAGAISIAGNLLISALTNKPSAPNQTPSYAFDGPKSLAQSGTVIPKGYGTFRSGGNIIASFVDVEGSDQFLNCLVCYGFGPARSISQIQINGKDIATYQNVQYYVRYGLNDQGPLPNFNRVVNGYPQNTQCLAGVPVVVPGTGTLTQILQVDVAFPTGLFVLTKDGNYIPLVITYLVEYSVAGAGIWQPVIQPLNTYDVITFDPITGLPNPYNSWVVMATDLPAGSGVVYYSDNGPHTPGDLWSGSQTVTTVNPDSTTGSYTKTFQGEWQPVDITMNLVQVSSWTAGYQSDSQFGTQELYQRTSIYGLAPGKYDVRVTKYGSGRWNQGAGPATPGDNNSPNVGQELWIHSVNEISLLDLAYPNMILVGVRALATNQIGGANVNITALVEYGLRSLDNNILPGALQAYEEDNPAAVSADMMLDGLYGGGQWPGVTAPNIDRFIDEWLNWAELNDTLVPDGNGGDIRLHVFNGVFDNESNLWDQLTAVGRMSRAQLIPLGRDYGVFVEQIDVPVQMFTVGNILADSFNETWLDIDSRANQVELQFADSTRFYKQDNPLVYMDPANQDAGVAIKNVRVDGRGVTVPAQAWHLARFKERQNQFLLRTGTFKCDLDSVASRPGNVVILQHDVPQWGWGGRTLPGSSASAILLDRDDIPFVSGTSYSVIVLHAALLRYSGTVSAVAVLTDVTSQVTGTQLTLSSFDNVSRVTRAIVNGHDCPILSSGVNLVVIAPIPGFTPAAAQTYQLFDTDVMETRAVSGISAVTGAVMLSSPLSMIPADYSTYFYGVTGSQKLVRIATVKKASEFRAQIEWIDYDARSYDIGTPVVGSTSAQIATNPGVTKLRGGESFQLQSGSYLSFANLFWQNGPDTVGVGIYAQLVGTLAGSNANNGLPQLVARLTNQTTSWKQQVYPGVTWKYTVVGFDVNNSYAAFSTAPSLTIIVVGITKNLLLGSNFVSGFTYWNLTPRAGDALVATFDDDGQATYTVAGTALTVAQTLLFQLVQPAKWAIGEFLMLSAYFEDSCLSSGAPNVGDLVATIAFIDASGTLISGVSATCALSGIAPVLTLVNTASTVIPLLTASIAVQIGVAGTGLSIPVGSVLTVSHLLLEISTSGQTLPSEWADIDAAGNILDLFGAGSSSALRTQGSLLPSFTGGFSFALTDTTITISWTSLVILWPDGAFTYIQDNSLAITGLTASTLYQAYPYFDIVNGGVKFVLPATAFGTPAILTTTVDPVSDAQTRLDNRVALAAGGLAITTTIFGGTGSGTGGGGSGTGLGGGDPYPPLLFTE